MAYGVPDGAIYTEGSHTVDQCVRSLRKGDELAVLAMSRLGSNRKELQRVLGMVSAIGGVVVELATGRRTDNPQHTTDMIFDALAQLAGEGRNRFTSETGKKAGVLGGRPKKTPLITRKEAMKIWMRSDLTVAQAVDEMGITMRRAYRWLGPRGMASGRPRKQVDPTVPPVMVVYFAQSGRRKVVKIGTTSSVKGRMSALSHAYLQDMRILATLDGGFGLEKQLHKRFKQYRIRGEWFKLEGELERYISKLPKYDGKKA